MLNVLLGPVMQMGNSLIERLFPDPQAAAAARLELQKLMDERYTMEIEAARDVIVAEAKSGSWLTSNWRPMVMMLLTCTIVAHVFGLTDANLDSTVIAGFVDLVKLGLGGYVIGRSVEKVAPSLATAIANRSGSAKLTRN